MLPHLAWKRNSLEFSIQKKLTVPSPAFQMFYVDLPSFADIRSLASKDLAGWDVWASALFPQFIGKANAESIARGTDCFAKRRGWEYENSERKPLIAFTAWNLFPRQNGTWMLQSTSKCLKRPHKKIEAQCQKWPTLKFQDEQMGLLQ